MIDYTAPDFWQKLFEVLLKGTGETLYMTAVATVVTIIVGIPVGVLLVATERGGFLEKPFGSRAVGAVVHAVLGFIVNLGRSVPFIVLMIALIPVTRLLVGTFVGTGAAIVPLAIVGIPFFARLVEIALKEVDPGLIEAASALGASRWQLVRRVLLGESRSSIVLGVAATITAIINYSAMVGVVGGGGLGNVALSYGWQRYSWIHVLAVVILLFIIVQLVQWLLTIAAKRLSHRGGGEVAEPRDAALEAASMAGGRT